MRELIVLVFLVTLPLVDATDMGVSPGRIIKENLLAGSVLEEHITLSKSSEESIIISAAIDGDAKQWVEHPEKVTFTQGMRRLSAPLKIVVPSNAQLGEYKATINYFVEGEHDFHMAFSVPVHLTITEKEDFSYEIKHVNTRQEKEKTVLSFEVYNKGNVLSGPTSAEILILDNLKRSVLHEKKKVIKSIAPFSIEKSEVSFPTWLTQGNYWVNVTLKGNEQEYAEEVFLEIEPNKNPKQQENVISGNSEEGFSPLFFALLALLFIGIALFLSKGTAKKRAKRKKNKKGFLFVYIMFFLALEVYAQIKSGAVVLNAPPEIPEMRTYSAYASSTDNMVDDSFFLCIGESEKEIYFRISAKDNNSYSEISSVNYSISSMDNGSETPLTLFANGTKEPVFESFSGLTQVNYIDNVSLNTTNLYRIVANVTDVMNASAQRGVNFTLNDTECIRIGTGVNVIAYETYHLEQDPGELSLVRDDNITGRILITPYNESPVDNGSSSALDKYTTVDVVGAVENLTINLTLSINYSQVSLKALDESSLRAYSWINNSTWVQEVSTVDIVGNTVTFVATGTKNNSSDLRLGTYSLRGSPVVVSSDEGDEDTGNRRSNYFFDDEDDPGEEQAQQEESEDSTEESESASPSQSSSDSENLFISEDDNTNTFETHPSASRSGSFLDDENSSRIGDGEPQLSYAALAFLGLRDPCMPLILLLLLLLLYVLYLLFKERKRRIAAEQKLREVEHSKQIQSSIDHQRDVLLGEQKESKKKGGS